jgi:REP element-mobilizing transposase RayT
MHEATIPPARAAHRLYVHVVWPTLGRLPLIPPELRCVTEGHLITLCRRLDAEPVCVRVLVDRVHVLVRFKPTHSVAHLVARLKAGSEDAMSGFGRSVRWGRGYAASTLGGSQVRRTMRRIVTLAERRRSPVVRARR